MLTISTIPEALSELDKRTGRVWTDSELFDVATTHSLQLHAAAPITARTTIQTFVDGVGLVEKFRSSPGHDVLAALLPWQVGQLWISGETATSQTSNYDEIEGEYRWFTEPVPVTREQVRIRAATLQKILKIWETAQSGPWIRDEKQAGGWRRHWGPNWLFPKTSETERETTAAELPPKLPQSKAAKGITKEQVLIAFKSLVSIDLEKALGNGKGLNGLFGDYGARTQKGTRGGKHAALWDPVILAIGLHDEYRVPMSHLKRAFSEHAFLRGWADEWGDKLDMLER